MQANDWFRIDKADGTVAPASSVNVVRAARGYYDNVAEVIRAGRFQTPFAIYSQRQHLEKRLCDAATVPGFDPARDGALAPVDTCAHCGSESLGAFVCNYCGGSNLAKMVRS
jgi:hypothetical protein